MTKKDKITDSTAKEIIENMTRRYKKTLEDFQHDNYHKLPCVCWLCRWRMLYKQKKPGHPYDYRTFLAYDIFSEIADKFQYEPVKRISVQVLAREIIDKLPFICPEEKKILDDYTKKWFRENFIKYAKKGYYKSDKLFILDEELTKQIYDEWKKTKPEPLAVINLNKRERKTEAYLAAKIAKFVYSQPDHKTTQREILRHTNKRKSDLLPLHDYLKWRYGIMVPDHEKWESTVYIGTKPKRKTNYYRVPFPVPK